MQRTLAEGREDNLVALRQHSEAKRRGQRITGVAGEVKRSRPVSSTEVCSQVASYPIGQCYKPQQTESHVNGQGNMAFTPVGISFIEPGAGAIRSDQGSLLRLGRVGRNKTVLRKKKGVLGQIKLTQYPKKNAPRLLLSNRS